MSGAVVRVLIVDDHPIFRDGLRAVVSADPGCTLVGEAATGIDAVHLAEELLPDVVVMDLCRPVMSGVEATRRILARRPDVAVLVLTSAETEGAMVAAVRAGARGYLAKDAGRREIVQAVHAVAAGQVVAGSSVAGQVLARISGDGSERNRVLAALTPREREVLQLLVDGAATAEVARVLGVTQKTVRNQVSALLTKLQVPDRGAAVAKARALGVYPSGR